MAKKQTVCKKCGSRLVLARIDSRYGELKAFPDQEPYEAGKTETVLVDGQKQEVLSVESCLHCDICPQCGVIDSVWVDG